MKITINTITIFLIKGIRKVVNLFKIRKDSPRMETSWIYEEYCDKKGQAGNDAIFQILENYKGGGLMISKWGTIEFGQALTTYLIFTRGVYIKEIVKMVKGELPIPSINGNYALYNNAGVFPLSPQMADRFGKQALLDCQQIDILGSYIKNESYLFPLMSNAIKVNLDAFYAPWLFNNPWTKWLKGKKALVVHPFVESISFQYHNNRERLFDNPEVLPEFKSLVCIKAVQTQAGEKCQFRDWFEALDYMKRQIDECDYDVAIIGCGAYGMSLAAHVKRQGKVAIHIAGWTQMLFGVYGERWVSQQSKYSSVINQYWIRPNKNENVKNGCKIEGGCYW